MISVIKKMLVGYLVLCGITFFAKNLLKVGDTITKIYKTLFPYEYYKELHQCMRDNEMF